MSSRPLTLGLVLLTAIACSDASTGIRSTDGNPMATGNALVGAESGLTLDVRADTIRAGAPVRLVLANGSMRDVGYNLCVHVLERHDGDGWVESGLGRPQACILILHILEPGASARYETALPESLPAGSYRFRAAVHLLDEREFRDLVTPPFAAE